MLTCEVTDFRRIKRRPRVAQKRLPEKQAKLLSAIRNTIKLLEDGVLTKREAHENISIWIGAWA